MGVLQKLKYSHTDMIDFIIANPGVKGEQLAIRYGYTPGWISNVMASDAFQSALAARRDEIVDPALKATMQERFTAMTIQSLARLQEKLEAPQVSDQVVLRAVELGAKALGIGGNAAPKPAEEGDRLERLASRLIDLQSQVRQGVVYENEIQHQGAEGSLYPASPDAV